MENNDQYLDQLCIDTVRLLAVDAVKLAKEETARPSLVRIRTHIAYGSPNKVDTAGAHGAPLGVEEVKKVKEFFGWDPGQSFGALSWRPRQN